MIKDAIETLEYLLEQIDNGFDEGYKTMNSLFVKDFVVQAIKEIEQAEKQQALDKKADNARDLGLDYEQDHGFDRTASHMEGRYVDTAEQEPVAWLHPDKKVDVVVPTKLAWFDKPIPLYTSPPRKEWVGLTDDDLRQIILVSIGVAEAKLKEKNGG